MANEKKVPTLLRLPAPIREWLTDQACANGRTINGEAAFRLKKMMEAESNGQIQQA